MGVFAFGNRRSGFHSERTCYWYEMYFNGKCTCLHRLPCTALTNSTIS